MNILAIDPGSTSTKIGVYRGGAVSKVCLEHPRREIEQFPAIIDQLGFRLECIERHLLASGLGTAEFAAVVGRGGLLRPVEGELNG